MSVPPGSRAFTLVELLISMLLVTLVTFGIAQVFKLSQETVAVGQKIAEFTRDRRSARDTMQIDGANYAKDAPIFYIVSRYENIPNGHGGTFLARRDRIAFPIRAAAINRVTGSNGSFISDEVSGEGWVWYGHCNRSYTGDTVNRDPLQKPVPVNIVGRVCMLMLDPNTRLQPPLIALSSDFFLRTGINNDLTPLSNATQSTNVNGEGVYNLATGRYDLMGTTLSLFDQDVQAKLAGLQPSQPPLLPDNPWITPNLGIWWTSLLQDRNARPLRFLCADKLTDPTDPLGGPSIPPSSSGYAYTTPVFLRNVTEFIVQFSADVVNQDPATGNILFQKNPDGTNYKDASGLLHLQAPDGLPDYDVAVDNKGNVLTQDVRWFGLNDPRYPAMTVMDWVSAKLQNQGVNLYKDVDLTPFYFERGINSEKGYAASAYDVLGNVTMVETPVRSNVWLWVRGAPKMVRIIFKQEDPEGIVRDGPWTEFVIGPR
ncbi:MAG: PilW family protein [Tepidisphaerales bacterium]